MMVLFIMVVAIGMVPIGLWFDKMMSYGKENNLYKNGYLNER